MKVIHGDLVRLAMQGRFDLIVHGCNCFCSMEAGIAQSIKIAFPEAFRADCMTACGDRGKLGKISYASVQCSGRKVTVVNAYIQYHWRGEGVLVEYNALQAAFVSIKENFPGQFIAYPRIGAGLAGGNWRRISDIIDEALCAERHCLVAYVG